MPSKGEIKSEKILVKNIFSRMWFSIPEYQRPYVWGTDEINELLDDLAFAMAEKNEFEYFLGSFVFQSKAAAPEKGQKFDEMIHRVIPRNLDGASRPLDHLRDIGT